MLTRHLFRRHSRPLPALAVASFLLAGLGGAQAATNYYWDPTATLGTSGGGTGNWNLTAGNTVWFDGSTDSLWINTNLANFGGTAGTVTVNGAVNAGGITFSTGGYTLNGTATLTLGGSLNVNAASGSTTTISAPINVSAAQTWTVATGNTLNLSSNMSGNAVIFSGPGTQNISSGTMTVAKFTVAGGATVNWSGTANIPAGGSYTGAGDNATPGTLNIVGGSFSTAATVFMGNGTTGIISVSAGTFTMTGANTNIFLGDGYNNNGAGNGSLNLSGTGKFTTGTTAGSFYLGNKGAGTGTVNLDGGTLATNRTITRSSLVSGSPTGTGTLNFNGGTLQATGSALAITGLTQANVRDGGAIIDTNGFDITLSQALVHSGIGGDNAIDGGLIKKGNGTLNLNAGETYTGPTLVQAGTLLVNGVLVGTSRADVSGSGTLGGNGTIGPASGATGQVTLASGAHLAPGMNGMGALQIALSGGGNFDLTGAIGNGNTGALAFELGAPASSDLIFTSGGPLTIGSGLLDFDDFSFSTLAGFDPASSYTLFLGDTPIAGTLGTHTIDTIGGQLYELQLVDNHTDVVLVAIPEPASAAFLLAGAGMFLVRRRRRS